MILSTTPESSSLIGGRGGVICPLSDYEDGGIALNDPSEGLMYQVWHGELEGSDIIVSTDIVAPTVVYTGTGISELSITFDQNMRICIALVQNNLAKLVWHDPNVNQQVTTTLAAGITSPRVSLNDKRPSQISTSNIILGYLRAGNLCIRKQSDRYGVEYILATGVYGTLIKIGMNTVNRFEFVVRA